MELDGIRYEYLTDERLEETTKLITDVFWAREPAFGMTDIQ